MYASPKAANRLPSFQGIDTTVRAWSTIAFVSPSRGRTGTVDPSDVCCNTCVRNEADFASGKTIVSIRSSPSSASLKVPSSWVGLPHCLL